MRDAKRMSDEADELDRAWDDAEQTLVAVFAGDARAHLRTLEARAQRALSEPARAVWHVAAAMAAVIACRFDDAARLADRALREVPQGQSPEYRLAVAAASMTDAMSGAQHARDPHARDPHACAERGDPAELAVAADGSRGDLLVRYLAAEAALSSGAFDAADTLIAAAGLEPGQVVAPGAPGGAPVDGAAVALQLLWARSSAFHGRAALVRAIHDGIQARAADVPARAHLVFLAIGCYGAALAADRDRATALADVVLHRARRDVNYLSVGSCIYVGWALRALGQVQRAAALLVAAAGPDLRHCKIWDRAFISEVLVEAALDRGDRYGAATIVSRATALQRYPVATAAVTRARGAVARSDGLDEDARGLASAAISLDSRAGAATEVLRGRVLEADALIASAPEEAARMFASIASEADTTGNESLRRSAAGRWRALQHTTPGLVAGTAVMTARQREVVALVAEGHSNIAIAQVLFLSARTVQTHVSDLLRITGARSRAEIAALAARGSASALVSLTPRQREIAGLIARGLRNAEIARALSLSDKTVENHVSEILRRLGLRSRAGVAGLAAPGPAPSP